MAMLSFANGKPRHCRLQFLFYVEKHLPETLSSCVRLDAAANQKQQRSLGPLFSLPECFCGFSGANTQTAFSLGADSR